MIKRTIQTTFCFDIDGTICQTKKGDYSNSKPKKKIINLINKLYDTGHYIYFYTSRFNQKYNFNKKKINKVGYDFTKKQLDSWGVKYHKLIMMKPDYDYIIDDKFPEFKKSKWYEYLRDKYVN